MKQDCLVTVLTATYNRGKKLLKLFQSLKKQTDYRFQWIIVDDGSTDGTEIIVNNWKSDNFKIIYKRKDNGGKHTAINYAMSFINTPLVYIVDSDDYLTDNSIETVIDKYTQHSNETDICGLSFLRGTPEGGLLSSGSVPINGMRDSFVGCRLKRHIGGDMAEVWFTEVLRKYPFPVFQNEKFLGEDIVWIKMALDYEMYFYNDVIYISEYLDDGLTRNRRIHNIKSPKGCVERAKVFLEANIDIKSNVKAMMQYIVYGKYASYSLRELYSGTSKRILFIASVMPSLLLYEYWKSCVKA